MAWESIGNTWIIDESLDESKIWQWDIRRHIPYPHCMQAGTSLADCLTMILKGGLLIAGSQTHTLGAAHGKIEEYIAVYTSI